MYSTGRVDNQVHAFLPTHAMAVVKPASPVPGRFRPRLTLQTLTRGDGLLGMKPSGPFGPRGDSVTVARADWTYSTAGGLHWETPAPKTVLNSRAASIQAVTDAHGGEVLMQRDLAAEAEALDSLWTLGLYPVPADTLQWRSEEAAVGHEHLWSLVQEDFFGDFWADQLPALQAQGWAVVVRPGFAHESVPVDAWRLIVSPDTGEVLGKEVAAPLRGRAPAVAALGLPAREGSWLLTLGVEVDGQILDLAPMLADLLRRDPRWINARQVFAIDDTAVILLRAPGGKRIEAPAALLKVIVGAMLDLLTDPQRGQVDGPLRLSPWDAWRLDMLDTGAGRAGAHGAWQWQGDAGLHSLARRLAGSVPRACRRAGGAGRSPCGPTSWKAWPGCNTCANKALAGILADDMGLGKTAQTLGPSACSKKKPAGSTCRRWWWCRHRCCSTGRPRPRAWRRVCAC
jgi:hypothetical protein